MNHSGEFFAKCQNTNVFAFLRAGRATVKQKGTIGDQHCDQVLNVC
jgi:hypothetical protein